MPAATSTTIKLANSGASLTATLTDGTNYALFTKSWSPQVAGDKPADFGGRPYNRVRETIDVTVYGTSPENALENLEKLIRILKLGEQWRSSKAKNVGDSPTLFHWELHGSSAGEWKSMVVGRADRSRPLIVLPVTFTEDQSARYSIEGVRLEFIREGELLGALANATAEATGASGDKLSITYADNWTIPGPCIPQIAGIGGLNAPDLQESFLFLAHTAADIQVIEAETATGGGTVVNENANNARGTAGANALELSGGKSYASISLDLPTTITHKNMAVYAVMRNNDGVNWRFYVESLNEGVVNDTTWVSTLDDSSSNPRPHFFGTVDSSLDTHTSINLYYAVDDADGPPSLTIDYFVCIGLDNPVNRVIRLAPPDEIANVTDFSVNPRALTGLSPYVLVTNNLSQLFTIPWNHGDAYCLSSGTNLTALWMAPSGTKWRWSQSGGTLISNLSFTAIRQRCALIPR